VDYYQYVSTLSASPGTGSNGFFSMQITITGLDPLIPLTNDFQLSQNRPNPFSSTTFFQALVP
jgi:hypothetical protein